MSLPYVDVYQKDGLDIAPARGMGTGIVLRSSAQWRTWYSQIRSSAKSNDVWEYVDPDNRQPPDYPRKPRKPLPSDVQEGASRPEHLDEANDAKLHRLLKHYDRNIVEYSTLNRALDRVMERIRNTLASEHQAVIAEIEDPRTLLCSLRDRFSPAEGERKIELYLQWGRLARSSPKDSQIDSWLNEWENLYTEAVSAGVPNVKDHQIASYEFLAAVRSLDESFHGIWYEKLFHDPSSKVLFTHVVNAFRQKRAIVQRKKPSSKVISLTTLDGQEEAGSQHQQPTHQNRGQQGQRKAPRCVCGQNHFFNACPYLVEASRPSGWKPDAEIQRKIPQNIEKLSPNARTKIEKLQKDLKGTGTANFVDVIHDPYAMFVDSKLDKEDIKTQEKRGKDTPYALFTENPENPFKDVWIIDSGSNRHIAHDRSLFTTFHKVNGSVKVGDTSTPFQGQGIVRIYGKHPTTGREIPLDIHDVKYSPGFHANLLSLSILKRRGYLWDTIRDVLIFKRTGHTVARIHEENGLFVLTQDHVETPAAFNTSIQRRSTASAVSKATPQRWHRRLGHMYDQRVEKLAEMAAGIELTQPSEDTAESNPECCEVCQLTKAKRQISRRVQGASFGPLGRAHFDLIQIREAYNGDNWITHFYLDGIRYHHVETHAQKSGCQEAVRNFVSLMIRWFNIPLRAFHSDNERSLGYKIQEYLTECGFIIETSVVGTPEMNSFAERSGGVIITRARSLLEDSKLPKGLWPEAVQTAAYILNRSPTKLSSGRWIIPHQEFHRLGTGIELQINLSNLRVYGCRTYVRIQGIPQLDKMHPRAEIGYLVGYRATNIWRIWFPRTNSVRNVRDAVFDEGSNYLDRPPEQPVNAPATTVIVEDEEIDREIQQAMQRLVNGSDPSRQEGRQEEQRTDNSAERQKMCPPQQEDSSADISAEIQQQHSPARSEDVYYHQEPPLPATLPTPSPPRQLTPDPTPQAAAPQTPAHRQLRPPPYAPERVALAPASPAIAPIPLNLNQGEARQNTPTPSVPGSFPSDTPAPYINFQPQPRQIRPRTEGISEDNIIHGTRKRRAPEDPLFTSYITYDDEDDHKGVLAAFATGISAPRPDTHKLHRDELPAEPQNWREMLKHPYTEGWLAAAGLEIESLQKRGTFSVGSRPQDRSIQILPLKWVFTYKYDSNGFLQKLKARICVRGDLQAISSEDKRAATLAARTARSIFALVAAFNLGTIQLDAVNAFLNSDLDEEVYTQIPEGFANGSNVWKLHKALYGLRKSPRLWQKETTRVLEKLNFRVVPEDPCLLTRSGIIIFFYVDDIIIVHHRSKLQEAIQLQQRLKEHWELREMGEASWFLGIRILRDFRQNKLWLCQDSYVSSMAARYHLIGGRRITTPLPVDRMSSFNGQATPEQIHEYQQKVGSALYATIITRPDAAKAASHLAEFLVNPGPEHLEAVNRLIRYLYNTRFHAIEYHPTYDLPALEFASDASFGDYHDRKSSEGYLCKLFGGAVDWKASKQRTVTTSTTEAELLALSEAAKSAIFWHRLLHAVNLEFDQKSTEIQCDNAQTIDLLTKETPQLRTKLRHVDIHHHWLRQEVQNGNVNIRWVATKEMAADGLTKLLPTQRHAEFMRSLGMVNIQHLIE